MTTAEYQDTYSLGIETIDAQHRRFFELLGQLVAARSARQDDEVVLQTLDAMLDYVHEHFAYEGQHMREFGFEGWEAHRQLHAGFVRKIIDIGRAQRRGESHLDDKLVTYLGQWFSAHICTEDPKYVELFRAHGL